ncbi:YhcU family protein [Bacillus sp. B15-48]|uniref:YhcU family protein n=1 Tax=Bacillus sp. B15-48 TaxID=1548601 RepID=UPI00193F734C|nr:YhcU family protein [Bacillus sp. B15-48]MBM4764086.1 hypothetical protein [Bacillus sp. B15-48]
MKIVFASTPDQMEKVEELAQYFYSEVLPLYFSDEDILEFEKHKVLHTTKDQYENFNTLGEAFRVITSLQTIISILESHSLLEDYDEIFQKNAKTLKDFGLYFPFEFQQFLKVRQENVDNYISVYSKAANSYLV